MNHEAHRKRVVTKRANQKWHAVCEDCGQRKTLWFHRLRYGEPEPTTNHPDHWTKVRALCWDCVLVRNHRDVFS